MVPHSGPLHSKRLHVTAVLEVPVTVAVNWELSPAPRVTELGATETDTTEVGGGGTTFDEEASPQPNISGRISTLNTSGVNRNKLPAKHIRRQLIRTSRLLTTILLPPEAGS